MNVLACGLNSYLGKAALQYLQGDGIQVHGLVRDQRLLISKLNQHTQAKLYNVDVIRYNPYTLDICIPDVKVAFYFTQTPELHDAIGSNFELLSIRNFIHFAKKNNCNRIIYVGTIYDRKYLSSIEQLFIELDVNYTIVVKDVAIGKGTTFEEFMIKMLKNKFIYLYKPTKHVIFRPIKLKDLMKWLGSVNWETQYIDQYVQYEGEQVLDIEDVIKMYQDILSPGNTHNIIPIKNRTLAKLCYKYFSGVPYDVYAGYIQEMIDRSDIEKIANIETVKSQTYEVADLII